MSHIILIIASIRVIRVIHVRIEEAQVSISILNFRVKFFYREETFHVDVVVNASLRMVVLDEQVLLPNILLTHFVDHKICKVASVLEIKSCQAWKFPFIFQDLANEQPSQWLLTFFFDHCFAASVVAMLEVAKMEDLELRQLPREHCQSLFTQV